MLYTARGNNYCRGVATRGTYIMSRLYMYSGAYLPRSVSENEKTRHISSLRFQNFQGEHAPGPLLSI